MSSRAGYVFVDAFFFLISVSCGPASCRTWIGHEVSQSMGGEKRISWLLFACLPWLIVIMWVCLKMVSTPKPNGFADHYPYEMAISLGIHPIFRQTHVIPCQYLMNPDDILIYIVCEWSEWLWMNGCKMVFLSLFCSADSFEALRQCYDSAQSVHVRFVNDAIKQVYEVPWDVPSSPHVSLHFGGHWHQHQLPVFCPFWLVYNNLYIYIYIIYI